ncbi:MAG: hypothetical protein AABX53_03370 [Nanoarchaeota archaeon]
MVSELHAFIKADKIFFGVRECTKHAKKIQKVFVPSDVRVGLLASLEKTGVEIEHLELNKRELTDKLALAFFCEAFGVKK